MRVSACTFCLLNASRHHISGHSLFSRPLSDSPAKQRELLEKPAARWSTGWAGWVTASRFPTLLPDTRPQPVPSWSSSAVSQLPVPAEFWVAASQVKIKKGGCCVYLHSLKHKDREYKNVSPKLFQASKRLVNNKKN